VPAGARPVLEKKFLEAIRARTEGHPQPTRPVEFEHATRDGRSIWIESLISPILRDGQLLGYQGVSRDVTARKVLEARMDFLTHNDALTGLPNRKLFEIRLEHALQSAISFHQKMAILLIDLDHFKNINDSLGHTTGDELLKTVAQRLSRTLRSGDTLARLGGDEFAVLLEHVERSEDVSRVAQDLLDALEHVMTLPNGTELDVGASLGISLYPDHAQSAGELLQYADSALYRAKAEGRRTFRYFSEELTHAARERLSLESQLRHAIARDELAVYYQPIVDIRSGAIVGAEALLRWHCADGQLIMPDRFIPIAEESNLILPIGEWVLRTACAQVQNWSKEGEQPLFIAVNLSPKQFVQRDLADQIQAILRETRLAPSRLELEITESAMMPEGENAGVLLDRLKSTGVSLAIDDFGTGYSSLSYLQRFPFDTLKIDRRFVQNVTERRDDIIIVNSIIRLAQSLNYTLLAEGVETEAQLEFLRNQGCNLYQGFLCSKAVPAEEFTQLLQRQARGRAA
jgi:diguanylate cyclase (GGDEF)-like protein